VRRLAVVSLLACALWVIACGVGSISSRPGTPKSTGYIKLVWVESTQAQAEGIVAASYSIWRSTNHGTYVLLQQGITAMSWVDRTVTTGNTYCYKLYAFDAPGKVVADSLPVCL
jgi:hypothetical protein